MTEDKEGLARQRFMILNLVRIAGLAMVLAGIAIAQGAIDLPAALGWILAAAGLLDFFFAPRVLARAWKSENR